MTTLPIQAGRISHACFEPLEGRQLYSVALGADQVLNVVGTGHADQLNVSIDANDATKLVVDLNGDVKSFDLAGLAGLNAKLGKGNDTVNFDESNGKIDLPATILGGSGNDLITSGSGNDLLDGGDGRDTINADDGDDVIHGGASADAIDGGGGDDQVWGDSGRDDLAGGSDSDIIKGGKGTDQLSGDTGDDDLDGGKGSDQLTGGDGADSFAYGTGGTDTDTDKTAGVDRQYKPFPMDRLPPNYQRLFHATFPNSVGVGYRLNDDQTFTMLYKVDGDVNTYHAYFSYTGPDPFANLDGVNLVSYEVAPQNLPPNTLAAFRADHPDGDIKEVFAYHDAETGKMANIRFKVGDEDSQWATVQWMDDEGHP